MTNPTPRDSAQLPPLLDDLAKWEAQVRRYDVQGACNPLANTLQQAREALRAQAANVEPVGRVLPYLDERLADHTCTRVENAGNTPGFTLFETKLGRHSEYQLYENEAYALWVNIGKALGAGAPPARIPADVGAQAGTVAARFASLLSELERRFPDPEPYSARAPEQRYLAAIDAASSPQPQAVAASSPAQAVDAVSGQMLHEHYFLALYPHLDRFRGLDVWGELDQQEKAAWNRAALQASRQPQPQAQQGGGEALEAIAASWDGCMYDTPGETIDIGADLRRAFAALATKGQRHE